MTKLARGFQRLVNIERQLVLEDKLASQRDMTAGLIEAAAMEGGWTRQIFIILNDQDRLLGGRLSKQQ